MEMNPRWRSQAPIQPFFDVFQTHPVIAPCERISSKSKINHTKMINEPFEGAVRRTSNWSATLLFSLHKNRVEIPNAQPRGFKAFTNSSKRVPKSPSITSV
jgi:hypothetical protein